jgi:hypothetical protein
MLCIFPFAVSLLKHALLDQAKIFAVYQMADAPKS